MVYDPVLLKKQKVVKKFLEENFGFAFGEIPTGRKPKDFSTQVVKKFQLLFGQQSNWSSLVKKILNFFLGGYTLQDLTECIANNFDAFKNALVSNMRSTSLCL